MDRVLTGPIRHEIVIDLRPADAPDGPPTETRQIVVWTIGEEAVTDLGTIAALEAQLEDAHASLRNEQDRQ